MTRQLSISSSILLDDGGQVAIDLGFSEPVESPPRLGHHSNFDVGGLEVHTHDSLQASNCLLDGLCFSELDFFLHDFLEGVLGLLVLRPGSSGFVSKILASRINLVQRRALLIIKGEQHGADTVGSHVGMLGIDLCNVCQFQGQVVNRDFVGILVLELGCNLSCPVHQSSSIWTHARHQAPHVGSDVVEVCAEILVHQLVRDFLLCHCNNTVISSQSH
mmetsp:Transcript_55795/g.122116  ORF Transcript_55795/g.122116 Transcript_55795/m.122116 type:complete len:218 (-) Transcript_55795:176-829(-)